jgi:hypothetical protein
MNLSINTRDSPDYSPSKLNRFVSQSRCHVSFPPYSRSFAMKTLYRFGLAFAVLTISGVSIAWSEELVLADGGRSEYRIVVADDASPSTKYAAGELQQFLQQISGAKLPIVSDRQPPEAKEIVLGANARQKQLDLKLDLPALGDEGYVIETVGERLVIAGGALRGNLYGVYGLLEDHLGCRWFTPDVSRIPKRERLAVAPIRERQIPALEYREPFTYDCFDGDWCARNRMNSNSGRLEARHGGKVSFVPGYFVHTFSSLVPPGEFFAAHPEYFSLVQGKRQGGYAQLCCTNEDVIRICAERTLEALRKHPEANVISVSQNDCFLNCECEKCQALAKSEGSQMAPVLQLVNRVAEAVEKGYPGKAVETLAYQWTRQPPKKLRPRKNVIIRLCSIECCFSHPLAACDSPQNKKFLADIEGWSKTGSRLWVWDYTTDFSGYLMPHPNQRVRGPNVRFFVEHGVKGIFEQDTYETPHGEMSELGGYLTAKLLWNPKCDEKKAYGEFLDAYYGPATEPIAKYLDLIHDYAERQNVHVGINAQVSTPHLTDEMLLKANDLWQEAENRVQNDAPLLQRVKLSRMSVDWIVMERARLEKSRPETANPELKKLAAVRFEPFIAALRSGGVLRLREGAPLNIDEYRKGLESVVK